MDAASDPNRPQTIFAIQTDNYGFSMVESDPESRFYYQNVQYKLTEHHPERGTPYSCTFDKVFAEKIKHILQRAAIEYASTERGDAYYAHIPSLRTFIFLAWAEENMHAPKMGKQHGRITYTSMGVRVEVPIRQAERAIRGLAPLFFCAKRGSMVEIQMKSRHRCTMT
ncbi:phage putative ATP-dependent DNA helicase [Salmonella phage SPFM9]|nr:phage putative ATP-dependent DNA helicase [Salmonella phage SPFM9]